MIMMGNKKKAITAILGPEPEEEKPEGGEMNAVGQELINCIHSHDVDGVISCFKAMYQMMCSGDESEEG